MNSSKKLAEEVATRAFDNAYAVATSLSKSPAIETFRHASTSWSKSLTIDSNLTGVLCYPGTPEIVGWEPAKNSQDKEPIFRIWGNAPPGVPVAVWDFGNARRLADTHASAEGEWEVTIGPLTPGTWRLVAHSYSKTGIASRRTEILSLDAQKSTEPENNGDSSKQQQSAK